ncbi:hypothetical protein ZWY2020_036043 [Hordeum vulgare]|nr:hypothetical protein ZWY2020_036043 [Hordeum vulgare]
MREPNLGTWPLPPGPQTSYCCHAAGRLSLHLQQAHGSATIASIPSLSLGSFHPNSVWLDQLAPPSRKSRTSTRRGGATGSRLARGGGGRSSSPASGRARAPPAGGGGHTTAGSAAPSRETAERSSLASLESEVQAYNSIHIHFLMRFLLAGTQQNDVGLTGYNSLQNFSSKAMSTATIASSLSVKEQCQEAHCKQGYSSGKTSLHQPREYQWEQFPERRLLS